MWKAQLIVVLSGVSSSSSYGSLQLPPQFPRISSTINPLPAFIPWSGGLLGGIGAGTNPEPVHISIKIGHETHRLRSAGSRARGPRDPQLTPDCGTPIPLLASILGWTHCKPELSCRVM